MAPFAILPDSLGIILWTVASISILFYAINKLPLQYESKLVVLAICLIELVGTVQNQQFNTISFLNCDVVNSIYFLVAQINQNQQPAQLKPINRNYIKFRNTI